jgi:KaiC/GvpD/RAD55 family RecA-like ATPase
MDGLTFLMDDPKPSLELERTVIANCIYGSEAALYAKERCSEVNFTGIHRAVWLRLGENASPMDIYDTFQMDFTDYVDLERHVKHVNRLVEETNRRSMQRVLRTADVGNPAQIIEDIYRVSTKAVEETGAGAVWSVLQTIESRMLSPDTAGVPIPAFPSLDRALLGFQKEKYLLISGNSGHGKTTMLCNLINSVVDENPVLFFSLEMTVDEIMVKLFALRSGVPTTAIQSGRLSPDEWRKVADAADTLAHGNLHIVTGVTDIHQIEAVSKSYHLKYGIRFVALDYLQLVQIKSRDERWEQLNAISAQMKDIARMGITVIALSQLNAKALYEKVPEASAQAGSYGILAPSDGAIVIHKRQENEIGSNFLVYVSKNRFGLDSLEIACRMDKDTQKIWEI